MATKKPAAKGDKKSATAFSAEEKAAMREYLKEKKAQANKEDGERAVKAAIAKLPQGERAIAERFHAIVKANAPGLVPRTWYGFPAYARDEKVICFFKPASKFKERYSTLAFSDQANLEEGKMWPSAFSITEFTAADEAKVAALVRRAVS